MRRVLPLLLIACWIAAVERPAPAPPGFAAPAGGWKADAPRGDQQRAVPGIERPGARYLLAVPPGYTPEQAYPLWIVLHGSGARPEDMAGVFRGGLTQRGAISVFPAALDRRLLEWNHPDEGMWLVRIVLDVAATYRIDPQRVYLAGHSMGGGGTWAMGAVLADLWAGLGPMAGWYAATPRPDPAWLDGLPIYCLHGDQDRNVPVEMSRMAMEALGRRKRALRTFTARPEAKDLVGLDVVYRELPGVAHNCFQPWKELGAPEVGVLVGWLSAQRKARPADLQAATARLAQWGKQFGWSPEGGPLGRYADERTEAPKRK